MQVSEFAVKRPQFTVMLFLTAVALGLSSLTSIPLAEDPTFPISAFAVVAVYPGATPTDMEQLVVDPLEEKLNALEDVKYIQTTIEDGLSVVTIEFDASTDAAKKHDDVLREVNALRPRLPNDLYRLEVQKFDLANVNIVQLALVSDTRPYAELREEARRLKERLEQVDGVRTVEEWATPGREVRVELDPGRLAALHLPAEQVVAAVQSENANIPGGTADAGPRRFSVSTSGSYRSVEEVAGTIVAGNGRATVKVGDLGKVGWGLEDLQYIGRFNGHRAVFVTANMKPGRRITEVRNAIWKELDSYEKAVPPGIALMRPFDQSVNVDHRLARLGDDFLLAVLLVLVTLLPLGWRASLIVMIALPLSLAIGVAALRFTGFNINQLSIVGFVISLGLLVDDSIVVVENISRFLRTGMPREQAVIAATRQITVPVLGCTATLVASFIPLLALPGVVGTYIRSLPLAVVFTILASLVVSLTIVPFLASRILSRHENSEGNRFLRGLNRVIDFSYGRWLHRTLAAPRRTLLVAGLLFAASLALVPVIGFSLFPKADTPQFLVRVRTPQGSSLQATDRAVRFAEGVLRARPEVRDVLANVGHGNPAVYYNIGSESERANLGEIFVLLRRWDTRRSPAMIDSLQARLDRYPDARFEVKVFENGPHIDAPIALRLTGDDLDTLRGTAARIEKTLASTPGTWNVGNPLAVLATGVRVRVDPRKAGLYGVATAAADRTVRMAMAGFLAGSVREADGQEYPIRVQLNGNGQASSGIPLGAWSSGSSELPAAGPASTSASARSFDGSQTLAALDQVYVTSQGGALVPLRQIADLELEAKIPLIQHYNKQRSVTLTANVHNGWNTDRVTRDVLRRLQGLRLPSGYRIIPAGEIESRQESFGGLNTAIILTIFIILAILLLEFGTFRGMLIVASVIPLGALGGLVALYLSGYTLSFTSMIGFVALTGIEIKNTILLVDFTNQLRREGLSIHDAVERAGRIRFLPILLTTMTAVSGLIPLAAQRSSLYSPLAVVLIGGLISSTVLARLVTPVMYMLLAPPMTQREPEPAALPVGEVALARS